MAKRVWTADERITKALLDDVLYGSADGESADDLTKLAVKDQSGAGSYALELKVTETFTADKALTITVNNANRAINLSGGLTLGGDMTTAAAFTTTTAAITLAANGAGSSVTLPATGTLATLAGAETLTNKTLTTPILASFYADAAKTHLVSVQDATHTLVGRDTTDTLTNKTLTTPVIASFYQDAGKTQLMTVPNTASDTLCAIAATQNLTNKTITAASLSGTFTGTPTFSGAIITFTGGTINLTAGGDYTIGTTDNNPLIVKTNAVDKFAFTGTLGQFTVYQTTANLTLIFSDPGGARNITFADPGGHDSVAYLAATQTLSGKTVSLSGNLTFASALDMVVQANTAVALEVYDATTKILAVNTQTGTDNVATWTFRGVPATFASAAGSTYSLVKTDTYTLTLTGGTGVTALSGLGLYLSAPTVTSASATTVALASTLYVAAPVAAGAGPAAFTAGYSAHFASAIRVDGNISLANAAYDVIMKADTAVALEISDGTNKLVAFDSRTTTDKIVAVTITGPAITVASAADSTYSAVKVGARTHTLTGGVGITALSGLQLYLDAPTVTSEAATAVTLASTLYVAAPVAAGGGPASFTKAYSAHFASAIRLDGDLSLANNAYDLLVKADTAACFEIYDATTKMLTINSQITTDNVVSFTFTGQPAQFASGAGSTYNVAKIAVHTLTLTGGVGVTALSGLGLYIDTPTVTSAAATTVALASTLYVAAPAAAGAGPASFTAAYAGHFAAAVRIDGNLSMANAAYDIVIKADTAVAIELSDGTTKLLAVDTRVTTDNVEVHTWTAPAPTFASAAGSTWIHHNYAAVTVTLTGGTGVTAMNGLQAYFGIPTITSGDVTTVTTASTIYIVPPAEGGSVTITNSYMINTSVAGCFLTAAGVWTDACSATHKFNIKDVVLETIPGLIDRLAVKTYQRFDPSDGGYERFGVMAEEAPDFLASADHLGVSAQYMAGFGLAAIQWLKKENEELKSRIGALEAQLAGA